MSNLIEPNLHPLIVHFAVAFLMAGPVLLFISAMRGKRSGVKSAGDWMLTLGIVAILAAIGAGLQAYYTVQHDEPSHVAMTDHRNWAIVTAVIFILFGIWRYLRRNHVPSIQFATLLFVPVVLLVITGWKGGHLVYYYGLGVSNLPDVMSDGHAHDHGEKQEKMFDDNEGTAHSKSVEHRQENHEH